MTEPSLPAPPANIQLDLTAADLTGAGAALLGEANDDRVRTHAQLTAAARMLQQQQARIAELEGETGRLNRVIDGLRESLRGKEQPTPESDGVATPSDSQVPELPTG